jgi:hypothetical protein
MADAIDAAGQPGDSAAPVDAPPAPPPGPTNAELIAMGVEMFRELVCVMLGVESPQQTLGEPVARAIGQAWEPVCAKYGVDLNRLLAGFGPELAAAATTLPLLFKAWRALNAEVIAKRRAQLAPPPAPAPAATAATAAAPAPAPAPRADAGDAARAAFERREPAPQ